MDPLCKRFTPVVTVSHRRPSIAYQPTACYKIVASSLQRIRYILTLHSIRYISHRSFSLSAINFGAFTFFINMLDLAYLVVALLMCNTSAATPILSKHLVSAWEAHSKNPTLAWLGLPQLATKLEAKAGLTNVQMPLEIFTVP